jgi:preprotein translocase subunit SecG
MEVVIWILLVIHIGVCALLVGAVLMQLPRSEGLGAAFGGGVAENVFGAQTTHVLAKATVWLGVAFFVITLLLAVAYAHNQPSTSQLEKDLLSAPIPEASPTPSAVPASSPTSLEATPQGTPTSVENADISAPALTLQPEAAPSPTPILEPVPANP